MLPSSSMPQVFDANYPKPLKQLQIETRTILRIDPQLQAALLAPLEPTGPRSALKCVLRRRGTMLSSPQCRKVK